MNQDEKWAKTIDKNIKMVNKYTKKMFNSLIIKHKDNMILFFTHKIARNV